MHDRASNSCCNSSSVQSGFGSTIAGVRRVGLGDNVLRVNVRFRACAAGDANVGLENKSPPPRACGDITDDIVTIAYTSRPFSPSVVFSTQTSVLNFRNVGNLQPKYVAPAPPAPSILCKTKSITPSLCLSISCFLTNLHKARKTRLDQWSICYSRDIQTPTGRQPADAHFEP